MALLATVAWHWFVEFAVPRQAPRPVASLPTAPEAARAVASRHLFGIADVKAEPAASAAQNDTGTVRLLGVAANGDGSGFAIVSVEGRPSAPAVVGQEFSPGMKLLAVRPDAIDYERAGARYQVRMPEKRPGADASRAGAVGASVPVANAAANPPRSKYPSPEAMAKIAAEAQRKRDRAAGIGPQ